MLVVPLHVKMFHKGFIIITTTFRARACFAHIIFVWSTRCREGGAKPFFSLLQVVPPLVAVRDVSSIHIITKFYKDSLTKGVCVVCDWNMLNFMYVDCVGSRKGIFSVCSKKAYQNRCPSPFFRCNM